MLKRTLATILALLLTVTLVLTGCSNDAGNGGSGSASTPSSPSSGSSTPAGNGDKVGPDIKLRFSSQSNPEAMPLMVVQSIIDEITEQSGGAIQIDLYPSNQLGDWTTVFNEVMMGTIDIAHTSVPDSMDPRIAAGYLMYMSTSYDAIRELYAEGSWLRELLTEIYAGMNVKYMGPSFQGFNGLGTAKELNEPLNPNVDKGVIIRCASQTTVSEGLADLGYRTSSIPYNEVYTSLQTGIVDGWLGGTSNTNYVNFRDVITHYYDLYIQAEVNAFNMSMASWNKLSPEQQEIVETAFRNGQDYMFSLVEDTLLENNRLLEESGVKVITYTPEELSVCAEKSRTVTWPKLEATYGADFFVKLNEELARIEEGA